jgi:hypothetical protein
MTSTACTVERGRNLVRFALIVAVTSMARRGGRPQSSQASVTFSTGKVPGCCSSNLRLGTGRQEGRSRREDHVVSVAVKVWLVLLLLLLLLLFFLWLTNLSAHSS